jgi:hypothetical protein
LRLERTASILSEAASLSHISFVSNEWYVKHLPAIVVVTVNVEDLLALDTEDSERLSVYDIPVEASVLPREHTFGET